MKSFRRFLSPRVVGAFVAAILLTGALAQSAEAEGRPRNLLATEKSLYLRQHATDPVNWYPWGGAAFEKARRENKPIFLSVGYSTCHWCHVMRRGTFADAGVARLLNEHFVSIKVDREERPDVDRVYMSFVQASTGTGGWPLTVWLTPELKPFFGGTYYPAQDERGRPGLMTILARIAETWSTRSEELIASSEAMFAALQRDTALRPDTDALELKQLHARALAQFAMTFDAVNGGFETTPKFPQPSTLEFLLDTAAASPDAPAREQALSMAQLTLRRMAQGGLHDQLGGGFHRYAVDAAWRIPHFEKMLYDQAQLARAYVTAFQITRDPDFADVARRTLAYVSQRLTSPAGAFYSAEDAESPLPHNLAERAEGAFYRWSERELRAVVGAADADLACFLFGLERSNEAAPDSTHAHVLYRAHTGSEVASVFSRSLQEAENAERALRRSLLEVRDRRPRPARDEKIVTSWNGLMISACARAAQALSEPDHSASATRAALFLKENCTQPSTGRLAHSYRDGAPSDLGFAEDYAFLIQGLLDLYEATFELRWLVWAAELQDIQVELFYDHASGGFFVNSADDRSVVLRIKGEHDDAEPSANSVSLRNLVRLSEALGRDDWRRLAQQTAAAFASTVEQAPTAMPAMLVSLDWLSGPVREVLIQGEPDDPATQALFSELHATYRSRVVALRIDRQSHAYLSAKIPLVGELPQRPAKPTAYVCHNFTCQLPTTDPRVFAEQLKSPAVPTSTR